MELVNSRTMTPLTAFVTPRCQHKVVTINFKATRPQKLLPLVTTSLLGVNRHFQAKLDDTTILQLSPSTEASVPITTLDWLATQNCYQIGVTQDSSIPWIKANDLNVITEAKFTYFKCIMFNARSVCANLCDLHYLLDSGEYDAIMITETCMVKTGDPWWVNWSMPGL